MENGQKIEPRSRDLKGLSQASGLSVGYWRKAIERGEISARRAGTKIIVLEPDFQKWLEARPVVREAA